MTVQLPAAPALRAVAFDLDGTLTDSAPGICSTVEAVLVEAGHAAPPHADVRAMIGLPLVDILRLYAPGATANDIDGLRAQYNLLYAANVIPATLLFPRTWSLLRACRASGLELALVTAKPTAVANQVLARCRVRGLFKSIVGGDRASRPKPYPDLMQLALSELDVPPEQTLLVGDGAHDVEMGRGAGARTCGVAWGVHEAERLHAAGADHVVHSIAELRALLLGSTAARSARPPQAPQPPLVWG
ncbi:MAG: HAD family hydrolase [Chloroflexota bacterium]